MRFVPALLVVSTLALATLRPAVAASTATSLAPGSRILHTFNFEETDQGNYESIPMFWSKVVGRGFPAYASGRFDHDIYRPHPDNPTKNRTSFRLDIDSGSAAYLFSPPPDRQIPVNLNADYYIIGFAKTTSLKYARAQITSWFADENGNLLPETERHSEPFVSTPDTDAADASAWHVLHFFIPGPRANTPEADHAKSLVLRLAILQPQQLAADGEKRQNPLGRFQLYQQDLKGTAWFDDITVFQLPRVSVEVPAAVTANIFNPGQPVDLDLTVADLAHSQDTTQLGNNAASDAKIAPLVVDLKITDPDGLLFASEKWPISTAPDHPWIHRYTRPSLPPGLYTATLDVADQSTGSLIARRQTRFACLAGMPVSLGENGLERTAPEFGISATDWPTHAWKELPTVLRDLNVGLLQLSAWRRDMSDDALRQRDPALDALLNALQRADIRVIAGFSEIPNVLASKLTDARPNASPSDDSLLALSNADPALWRPYASFLLARYSTLVDRWELGSPAQPFSGTLGSSTSAADDPYPQLYTKIYSQLGALLTQPQVLIPWNALFDFKASQYPNAVLDLRIPSVIKPGQIPSYLHDFKTASTKGSIFVHIDPLDDGAYAPADRVSDFAQRIIYARSANPTATLIDLPLTQNTTDASAGARTEPEQLLLAYRTLVRTLGNTTYRREIPLGTGIHAFLFAGDAGGTLALWNDGAADPQIALDLPLGTAPRVIELSGNSGFLPVDPATHLTHVPISTMPFLIDHIDANLLELRATFAFSTSTFPAGAGFLRTNVLLANPYSDPFSATMHMTPPPGWSVDPTAFPVSIAPGGTFRQPVIVRYPYTESAGPKTMAAKLTSDTGSLASADGTTQPLNLSVPVLVSSDLVETEGFARILPNGDLVIQQMITNIAPIPLNAEAYALVPGYARQQRFVLDLAPSQTTIKRFVFPMNSYVDFTPKTTPVAIAAALTGKSASIGLRQNDGKTLITKSLAIN